MSSDVYTRSSSSSPSSQQGVATTYQAQSNLIASSTTLTVASNLPITTLYESYLFAVPSGVAASSFMCTLTLSLKGRTSGTSIIIAMVTVEIGSVQSGNNSPSYQLRSLRGAPILVCGTGGILPSDSAVDLTLTGNAGTQQIQVATAVEYT